MEKENRKDPIENAAGLASDLNTAANLGKTAGKSRIGQIMIDTLFGGLSPKLLIGLGAVIVVLMILCLMISSTNASTLFNSKPTAIEDICKALKNGFVQKKKDARSYIGNYINNTYNCKGSNESMSFLKADNIYTFSSDACEITIDFEPELEEFAQHIDSHANAINSTLQFFEQGGSSSLTSEEKDVTEGILVIDEKGNLKLNAYGSGLISSYNSEYANNQSSAYFATLCQYSKNIFDYEKNTSEWTFSDFHMGKKEKKVTVCYKRVRQPDMTYKDEIVACSLPHDKEKTEIKYVDALFGHISVPMTYDVRKYKKSDIEKTAEDLIGQEMYLSTNIDDEYEKRQIADSDEANRIVDNIISDYELSYLVMYLGGSYGYGYSGLITSNGFNYLLETDDKATTAIFWAYSDGLNTILHNLPYRTDSSASGPSMSHQCTQFAATFFYDVYGFAALRGNGNMQADYLLKDCGKDSACPVKFERASSPAPGAIISLYPNHVVVVDEVDEDGTIYISEGNYNGKGAVRTHQAYSSLSDYIAKTGYTIKTIAIPIR